MREPDWDALADLQFLLYNRITGALNEAVSSMELSDMPEAQDKPPGYWKNRATSKVINVLNLFNAWTYLIRHKQGLPIPERAIRPFRANDLLTWVGVQLQLNPIPQLKSNPLLHANQETLQEAILLLHSAAYTQGSGVRMEVEASKLGAWFKVRFNRSKPLPNTLDELLESFGDHWRAQDTVFELKTARDFVALNKAELVLITTPTHGEFTFFVRAAGRNLTSAASEAPTWPSKTRPLDPKAVAAYEARIAARRAAEQEQDTDQAAGQQVAKRQSATQGVEPAAVVDVKPAAATPSSAGDVASPEAGEVAPATPATPTKDTAPSAPEKPESAAPETQTAASESTPVMKPQQAEQPAPQNKQPPAPAVDVLRPLPPPLSELQRRAALRESQAEGKSEAPEKAAPPPEETGTGDAGAKDAAEQAAPGAAASTDPASQAPPEKPAAPPDSDTGTSAPKIVSLKIPDPTPPPALLHRIKTATQETTPAKETPTPPGARTTPADPSAPGTESGEHPTPPAAQEQPTDESADKAANGSADNDTPPATTRKDTP